GTGGKVTAITTDCEPSMVRMGRLLEQSGVCTHIGCCNHRLESTTSLVFNGPGVKTTMTLARGLVSRYTTSSQMADRLAQFVNIYLGSDNKKPIQDVVTRWWSSCAMGSRLVELKKPIRKHEEADKLELMLRAEHWAVLEMILPILEPFMHTQTLLEGRKYVTGRLVVPFIHDLRDNLEAAVMPCVKALHEDFINRWGDGNNILTYAEGSRRQPRGFKSVQVLATALDPHTKMLYGTPDDEHADMWKFVQSESVKVALATRQEKNSTEEKDHGTGGVNKGSEEEVESEEDDSEENQDGRKSRRVNLDPLDWWRKKSADFPHLSILARRVLAIPATQAESERLFSCAGNIGTKNRNKLASSTVELLVLL
ncbi:unnamed protein product, partial [Ectocarpus sp. 4 AP-2014]